MKLCDLFEDVGKWGEWVRYDGSHSLPLDACCHFSDNTIEDLGAGENPFLKGFVHINSAKPGIIEFSALPQYLYNSFDTVIIPRLKSGNYTKGLIQVIPLDPGDDMDEYSFRMDRDSIQRAKKFAKSHDPQYQ